jgi:hypothetical protein
VLTVALSVLVVIKLEALSSVLGLLKLQNTINDLRLLVIAVILVHNGVTNVSPFYTIRNYHENS